MKKIAAVLILCIFFTLFHCNSDKEKIPSKATRILLVHPDLEDLTSIIHLIENNIIKIPGIELIGIFYHKAQSEYDEIVSFLTENDSPYITLHVVNSDLDPDNLFKINSCSEEFYRLFDNSAGVIFFGGDDFPAFTYGEKTNLLTKVETPYRHYFELSFLFHLLGGYQDITFRPYLENKPNYVIRGLCLGMQTMNVACGGTMYQDIPSEIYGLSFMEDVLQLDQDQRHRNYWHNIFANDELIAGNFHKIRLLNEAYFSDKLMWDTSQDLYVYSSHHQALKNLGKNLEVLATSMDGKVIEAVMHYQYKNVLGIQFHVEYQDFYIPKYKMFKLTPQDTITVSRYQILQNYNSYNFYLNYWKNFSSVVTKTKF
jgi:putative glutamine amidotransferase